MFGLTGRKALVTGATGGLGEEIARLLHKQGATVGLHGTRVEKLEALAAELGDRVKIFPANLSDRAEVKALGEKAEAELEGVDFLVNNAGIAIQGQLVDDPTLDGENYNRQWQVNVMVTIANTRAAAPRLTDGGRIIFVGSGLGSFVPFPGVADYAGTKWALAGYAKGIARDLGPRDITVNVVQPGIMPTDMAAEVAGELPNRDAILDMHPIRRIATLEEVAETICFLAGPHAGYINGQQITLAGGLGI